MATALKDFINGPDFQKKHGETAMYNPLDAHLRMIKGLSSSYALRIAGELEEEGESQLEAYKKAQVFSLAAGHTALECFDQGFSEGGPYAVYLSFQERSGITAKVVEAKITALKLKAEAISAILFLSSFPKESLINIVPDLYTHISKLNSGLAMLAVDSPEVVDQAFSEAKSILNSKKEVMAENETYAKAVEAEETNLTHLKTGLNAEVFAYHLLRDISEGLENKNVDLAKYPALSRALRTKRIKIVEKTDEALDIEANADFQLVFETKDKVNGQSTVFPLALFDIQSISQSETRVNTTIIYKAKTGVEIEGDEQNQNNGGTARRVSNYVNKTGQPVVILKIPTSLVGPGAKFKDLKAQALENNFSTRDIVLYAMERSLSKTEAYYA